MSSSRPLDLWTLLHWWESETEALVLSTYDKYEVEWIMEDYWRNVMESLEWRPEQANVIQYGKYPLQRYVCRDYEDDESLASLLSPPVGVYQELMELSPNSLRALDDHHSTILDNLCIFYSKHPKCVDILPLVHEAYPQATELCNCDKNLPLHSFILSITTTDTTSSTCCPSQNIMLRYLICQTPIEFIHSKNQFSHTPLDCLCYELNQIDLSSTSSLSKQDVLFFFQTHPNNNNNNNNNNDEDYEHEEDDNDSLEETPNHHQIENWKYILSLISLAATTLIKKNHHSDQQNLLPELHSAIYMQCPLIFIQIIVSLYPDQLDIREPSLHNYTPLEMIVSSYFITNCNNDINKENICRAIHQESKRDIFQFLLQQQNPIIPKEESIDTNYSLPIQQSMYGSLLDKSLKCGNILYFDDAIDLLIELAPTALSIPHPIHQFYPFQLAATMGQKNNENMQFLETIYNLLREVPWLMEHFVPPE